MTIVPQSERASGHQIHGQPSILRATEGSVEVVPLPTGRFKVTLKPHDRHIFVPRQSCETSLPLDVISAFLNVSFTMLCDSLARHEDDEYVKGVLSKQLLAYCDASDFWGRRVLDFGCGSGASTFCLGDMFPETEVVGVDLDPRSLELARRVSAVRQLSNVQFLVSPDPSSLPPGIGTFDFVVLNAVYEHLLPEERRRVMPLIWSRMNDGGVLFINQTPYRYFPYEHHTTGLWFINYLPDTLSFFLARNRSRIWRELNKSRDWTGLLRGGIRGGTEREILRNVRRARLGHPTILQPTGQDRAAYWLSCMGSQRYLPMKKVIAALFRLTDKLWGTVPSVNLDVAIRKDSTPRLARWHSSRRRVPDAARRGVALRGS